MSLESAQPTIEHLPYLFTTNELFENARTIGTLPNQDGLDAILNGMRMYTGQDGSVTTLEAFNGINPTMLEYFYVKNPELFVHLGDEDMRELLFYVNARHIAELKLAYKWASTSADEVSKLQATKIYSELQKAHLLDQQMNASTEGFTYTPLHI